MPPSASATPPTQTTQRVPNFSSKPIACGVGDWADVGGESGTDGGGDINGAELGVGSTGAETIGVGAGAGADLGVGGGTPAAAAARSNFLNRSSSRRNSLRSRPAATTAITALTGAAKSNTTANMIQPTIGAPGANRNLRIYNAALRILLQVEPERRGFFGKATPADGLDGGDHAAAAAEQPIGQRHDADIGRRCRRGAAQRLRDGCLIALRIERTDAGIGARRRAADAHVAMHHQGVAAIPAAHEADEIGDVFLAWHDVAVERRGNIVQPQPQMVLRCDALRPHQIRFVADQRHDMARAGVCDDFMKARERADVNHDIRNRLLRSLSYRNRARRKCDVHTPASLLTRSK